MRLLGVLIVVIAAPSPLRAQAPAHGDGDAVSWRAGGEARLQYERFTNEEWGAVPDDRSGYFLQRYMLHAARRLGRHAEALVELKSGIEVGRTGGPRVPDEDRLDLHQGYVEARAGRFVMRAGRQELSFGSSRLVSVRDLNVRQSFDALRLTTNAGSWRIDAVGGWAARTSPGAFDDATDRGRALWGVYAERPSERGAAIDLYYLGYRRRTALFESAAGRERRHTYGLRLWGIVPTSTPGAGMDYNTEIAGQTGSVGLQRIWAWTVASDTGYRAAIKMNPRFGLHADITSGDRDPNDRTLGTFNAMFPRGPYFGPIASAGPANHIDLNPELELRPGRATAVSVGWLVFWRQTASDGLYSVPGSLLRAAAGTSPRFVGHSPRVSLTLPIGRVVFSADLSAFSAGPFIKATGDSTGITFVRTSFTYRLGRPHGD